MWVCFYEKQVFSFIVANINKKLSTGLIIRLLSNILLQEIQLEQLLESCRKVLMFVEINSIKTTGMIIKSYRRLFNCLMFYH